MSAFERPASVISERSDRLLGPISPSIAMSWVMLVIVTSLPLAARRNHVKSRFSAAAADDEEGVVARAGDGEVGLDTALVIAPLCVDGLVDRRRCWRPRGG